MAGSDDSSVRTQQAGGGTVKVHHLSCDSDPRIGGLFDRGLSCRLGPCHLLLGPFTARSSAEVLFGPGPSGSPTGGCVDEGILKFCV